MASKSTIKVTISFVGHRKSRAKINIKQVLCRTIRLERFLNASPALETGCYRKISDTAQTADAKRPLGISTLSGATYTARRHQFRQRAQARARWLPPLRASFTKCVIVISCQRRWLIRRSCKNISCDRDFSKGRFTADFSDACLMPQKLVVFCR